MNASNVVSLEAVRLSRGLAPVVPARPAEPPKSARELAAEAAAEVTVPIVERDSKRFGTVYPGKAVEGHRATIVPGKSITLHGYEKSCRYVPAKPGETATQGKYVAKPVGLYSNHFELGDWAEVHSYNLVYTGRIRKITAKTVTIIEYEDSAHPRTYRLSIADFDRKNWDFDAVAAAKRNSEWSD